MLERRVCSVFRLVALGTIAVAAPAIVAAQQTQPPPPSPPEPTVKEEITVVAPTPLPGIELPLESVPAPVQTATSRDIEATRALDLSDFINRRLTSVHVNDMQGNPFQADVSFRGSVASPLLGTPQGLSVYMDGVRLNQPFGDVV